MTRILAIDPGRERLIVFPSSEQQPSTEEWVAAWSRPLSGGGNHGPAVRIGKVIIHR